MARRLKHIHSFRVGSPNEADDELLHQWLGRTLDAAQHKERHARTHSHSPVSARTSATTNTTNINTATAAAHSHSVSLRHSSVQRLCGLVEDDPQLCMYFHLMFDQLPPEQRSKLPIKDYRQLLIALDFILSEPCEFNKTGLVGFPINAILNWPMATEAGFAAFNDCRVNDALKEVLDEWGRFLTTPASCKHLNDISPCGWFSQDALEAMPNFAETFRCDPTKPHWGFLSWDDFFTRTFRPNMRPVASPDDDSIVCNACESGPYNLVQGDDLCKVAQFWVKGQPYSLKHIFRCDPKNEKVYEEFVGGSLYQAFLSATCYHRWHSPVNGRVVRSWHVPGTYYAEAPYIHDDDSAPNESQGFIAEVATRAIILIEADNPHIGLMAFVAVGMAEVSTCEVTVRDNQRIRKGDEIGMFHFGGSTHLLLFRSNVVADFCYFGENTPKIDSEVIPVNSPIARIGCPKNT